MNDNPTTDACICMHGRDIHRTPLGHCIRCECAEFAAFSVSVLKPQPRPEGLAGHIHDLVLAWENEKLTYAQFEKCQERAFQLQEWIECEARKIHVAHRPDQKATEWVSCSAPSCTDIRLMLFEGEIVQRPA